MKLLRSTRWLLLALVITLVPVASHAGVFISVGIAPPVLLTYDQPPCPEPNLIWTPGYWAYGDDGYYWVPGAWVPAPYPGALWTPGYWGWDNGMYIFHDGYWGRHVGYYGGVNYGYGYGGMGFSGGEWRGGVFTYNTAVMHVDRRFIRSTYEDRRAVDRGFVDRGNHVAFSGGPGGIHYRPSAQERMAGQEQHMGRTSFQTQHESAARSDRGSYFSNNSGRPAAERPMGGDRNTSSPVMRNQSMPMQRNENMYAPRNDNMAAPRNDARPAPRNDNMAAPRNDARPAPRNDNMAAPRNDARPAQQSHSQPKDEHDHR
jgi:hypothetical protein